MQNNRLQVNQSYYGFKLIERRMIEEIEGSGYVFRHEKSGISVIILDNDDPQMTFSIGFSTPPENDKGIPHILEHTVCCASEKYPLKETLTALEQGSICNIINACTYPDMTMYYAASPNEKDIMGIAEVFIDMVFNPRIYSSPYYFRQEGWCYEVDNNGEFEYGGVVYNEMEGIYAEASTYLEREIYKSFFGGTPYEYDAGGVPSSIVNLSEEELLSFHREHYKGENCVVVFYGKGDIESKLRLLEENSLGRIFTNLNANINSEVSVKKVDRISSGRNSDNKQEYKEREIQPKTIETKNTSYPLEGEDEKYILSLSFLVNEYINVEHRLAFEILDHMLLKSAASPLTKKIITERNLGVGLAESGYDTSASQSVFSVTLKGAKEDKSQEFKDLVYEELSRLVEEGLPKELVDASINTLKFSLKEKDAGYEPIGIQYSEVLMKNIFYGSDALEGVLYIESLEKIISLRNDRYFENIIERYFLNNKDVVLLAIEPSKEFANKRIEEKYNSLKKARDKFSTKQLKELADFQERLRDIQLKENEYEELKILPHVTKNDLPMELDKIISYQLDVEGNKVVVEECGTNGIAYVNLLFDTSVVPQEDIQYLGVMANLLTYVGTCKKSYEEIENNINTYTGGINCALHCYLDESTNNYLPVFKISSKFLNEHIGVWGELMCEILNETIFEDKNKIKEVIGNIIYELQTSIKAAPEYHSVQNIYTYISEEGRYINEVGGINFYRFLKPIHENFEEEYEKLKTKLKQITKLIFNRRSLTTTILTSKNSVDMICSGAKKIIFSLEETELKTYKYNLKEPVVNEAFIVEQELQAVAAGINFKKHKVNYTGDMEVVMNILESGYLWDRIRLQGGAYGTEILLSQEGYLVVSTYCDPNINRTLDVFDSIGDYLQNMDMKPEQYERYVVSTLGAFWAPISMDKRSERLAYMVGTNTDTKKRDIIYQQILSSNSSVFKVVSNMFKIFSEHRVYSVIGNEDAILKDNNIFNKIYKNI